MPSDADILRSVRSAISRGEEVIMAVRGRSMIPYLRPGHDEVLLSPIADIAALRPGDILLAAVSPTAVSPTAENHLSEPNAQSGSRISEARTAPTDNYHQNSPTLPLSHSISPLGSRISEARTENTAPRLILHRLIGRTPGGQLILMGDGNLHQRETCSPSDIIARVSAIIDTADQSRRAPSRATLWRHLLPLRPILIRLLSP